MLRFTAALLPILFVAVESQAASITTTLSLTNAPLTISATGASVSGTATLTNLGTNGASVSGPFSASGSLSSATSSGIPAPFTITLPGGILAGTLNIPLSILEGSSTLSGSATISSTNSTGAYAGATGSFPSLTGSTAGSIVSSNLTLSFSGQGTITLGGSSTGGTGGTTATTPTVTAVLDAASNTAKVAQGSIFIVKGTNLSASGYTSFGFPLPQSSGGVSITFTLASGGTGTNAYLVYTYNESGVNQLAAILPSTVAPGSYNVTVTSGGATSTPFAATVVPSKFEAFTQDSTGTGLAVVQNYVSASQVDLNRFTTGTISGITISPAKPGQPVIVWGTGMGPVTSPDNQASPGYDFSKNGVNVQAIVGGVSIPVAYAGRTPTLAGEDEVVFTLPSNIPTGCTVSLQISVNGTLSSPTFLAIAPDASSSACVQPGYTTTQLQNLDNGGTITTGGFSLTQIQESESLPTYGNVNVKIDEIGGSFEQFSGFQLSAASQYNVSVNTSGACQVITVSGTSGGSLVSSGTVTYLDAGAVTLNGPNGSGISNAALTEGSAPNYTYSLSLGIEGLPVSIPGSLNASLVAGTYTVSGKGGKDVGSFNVSINLGTPLVLNPALPSTVSRSSPLQLGWTGGNSSDSVEIIGYSGTTTTSGTTATTNATEFICTTTAGTGAFTVPASVLSQLPATASTANGGTGFLEVSSGPAPTPFSPSLTAGGNVSSVFSTFIGTGALVTYQ